VLVWLGLEFREVAVSIGAGAVAAILGGFLLGLGFAGILGGLVGARNVGTVSYLSHAVHVLISSFASTFYFVSFGVVNWTPLVGGIFVITVVAVILPCCLSDIVLPIASTPHTH
jgi:hypothetical protein